MGCKTHFLSLFLLVTSFICLSICGDWPPPPPPPPPDDILPPGSVSYEAPATPAIQSLINMVRSDVEIRLGGSTSRFDAVKFRQQTVAGYFYWVKVNIGSGYIHIKIFEGINGDVNLIGIIENKSESDPILTR